MFQITRENKITIIICVLVGFLGTLVGRVLLDTEIGFAIILISILFMLFAPIVVIPICNHRKIKKEKQEQTKKETEELELRQQFLQSVAQGNYRFPYMELYTLCIKAKCVDISASDYNKAKTKMFADQILKNNEIPSEYYHLYDSDERLSEYLRKGEKAEQKKKERQKLQKEQQEKKKEEKRNKPQQAKLTEAQKDIICLQNSVAELFGKEKKRFYLTNSIEKIELKMKEIEPFLPRETKKLTASESIDLLQLSTAIRSSAMQEKPIDWSVAGGIASGLAGPAAGLAVAADTMQKNATIEARNQQNRDYANKLADDVNSIAIQSLFGSSRKTTSKENTNKTKYYNLESKKKKLQHQLDDLDTKILLENIEQSHILQSLEIVKESVNKKKSNVLEVSIEFQNNLKVKNMPENVNFVVDGTFKCEVYAGEIFVGWFNLPLPVDGIECGQQGTAKGYCNMYIMNQEDYTVKIKPNALWVMEQ